MKTFKFKMADNNFADDNNYPFQIKEDLILYRC